MRAKEKREKQLKMFQAKFQLPLGGHNGTGKQFVVEEIPKTRTDWIVNKLRKLMLFKEPQVLM